MADQDLRETLLRSETVFQGRMLKVVVDSVRLPNGQEASREVVKHPGAVAVVAIDGERVLLIRQYRHAVGDVLLEIPAGKLEPGESPLICAQRELLEETGMLATTWTPLGRTIVSPGFTDEVIHLFRAEDLRAAEAHTPDADEFIELAWMTREEARSAVRDGRIVDAKTQVGLALAAGF